MEAYAPSLAGFDAAKELVARTMQTGRASLDLDVALAAFLLNRCSRSGIVTPNVGPIGGRHQTGRWTVSSRWNGKSLADRIRAVAALAGRVKVAHGDGITRIEDLPGSGIEDEVFCFVDPPYIGVGNSLNRPRFSAALIWVAALG